MLLQAITLLKMANHFTSAMHGSFFFAEVSENHHLQALYFTDRGGGITWPLLRGEGEAAHKRVQH